MLQNFFLDFKKLRISSYCSSCSSRKRSYILFCSHSMCAKKLLIAIIYTTFYRHYVHAQLIDQSHRMSNTYTMVARDLWQCKPTSPLGLHPQALWIYCHKSLQPWYNYYLKPHIQPFNHHIIKTPHPRNISVVLIPGTFSCNYTLTQ